MKPVSACLLGLIQAYRWTLSSVFGNGCRYAPSCSIYARDAILAHGPWAGCWMALARMGRCHPWGGSGYDPAPAAPRIVPWWAPWRYGDWHQRFAPPHACACADHESSEHDPHHLS